MINNSSNDYQANYRKIHGSMNPYTVLRRHPSQEYVYDDSATPLQQGTGASMSADAVNNNYLNLVTIPSTADSISTDSFASRYIVPEVHHPTYVADDLKSIGNPYAHHANYATPSQYFSHLMDDNARPANSLANLLTSADTARLADPFTANSSNTYPSSVNAPNDVTLNKHLLCAESIEDLTRLNVRFAYKGAPTALAAQQARSTETLNKKMLTPESMYELGNVVDFEVKHHDHGELETNLLKIREFSTQSLADLRDLPNLSQYSNFNDGGPTRDVETCVGMSPTPLERAEFEYFENVQYGGV